MKKVLAWLAVVLCGVGLSTPTLHAGIDRSKNDFEVYGFGQVDYIQDFQRVDPNWAATMRASKIPTTEGQFGSDGQALVSARQSRLGAQGNLMTDGGPVFTKVEFDFFGVGADAGQTTIRFRHGYGEWHGILGGQTNSLFMDGDMWPNIIDYWGPSGMVFLRNPQIRWTPMADSTGWLAVAIEHPSNDVDAGEIRNIDPSLGASITSVSKVPDFTAQARRNMPFGYVQLGGILRRLGYEVQNVSGNSPHGSSLGWGLDLTSIVKVKGTKKDQILLSGVYGEGIANYMNDGGMDLAAKSDSGSTSGFGSAAVPLFGLMAYYDHWWNDKWSSSAGYGRTQVENTDLQTASAYHSGEYASANLIWWPTQNVFFGAEFLWGQRRDSGGAIGMDNRIQCSAHYKFSSKDILGK
jgi:hypothetical protein